MIPEHHQHQCCRRRVSAAATPDHSHCHERFTCQPRRYGQCRASAFHYITAGHPVSGCLAVESGVSVIAILLFRGQQQATFAAGSIPFTSVRKRDLSVHPAPHSGSRCKLVILVRYSGRRHCYSNAHGPLGQVAALCPSIVCISFCCLFDGGWLRNAPLLGGQRSHAQGMPIQCRLGCGASLRCEVHGPFEGLQIRHLRIAALSLSNTSSAA